MTQLVFSQNPFFIGGLTRAGQCRLAPKSICFTLNRALGTKRCCLASIFYVYKGVEIALFGKIPIHARAPAGTYVGANVVA